MTPLVAAAILNRIKADTGTGGLYEGSAWSIISGAWFAAASPATPAYPYVVYAVSSEPDDTFPADQRTFRVAFSIYDTADRGMDRVQAIMDRLYGDAMLQATRQPTYGLHRHRITIPSSTLGWIGGDVVAGSDEVGPAEGQPNVVVGTIEFSGSMSASAV